jgi:putative transposase
MARQARIIIPGCAHYVVHRARIGILLFRDDRDYARYRALLAEKAANHAISVNAAFLSSDHVELVLTPRTHDGLSRAVGETHRLYARHRDLGANALWVGRFQSCPVAPDLAAAMTDDVPPAGDLQRTLLAAASRGQPAGDPDFIARIAEEIGRNFTLRRRGRKP